MPRKSECLRLLEKMELAELRRFAAYHDVKAKTASDFRHRLVTRVGTSLEVLVSLRSPWSQDEWNELLVRLGGQPQNTLDSTRTEVRRLLWQEVADTSKTADPPPPRPTPRPPTPLPEAGSIIKDRYVLQECIGSGGFGTVFLAHDKLTSQEGLVLKFANSDAPATSVLNEYQKAARLQHPNICKYQHYDLDPGFGPFVVMQHGGISVAKLAEAHGLELSRALSILQDTASALDYAHGQGVLHGDVSPGNVLVGSEDRVQLTDFGIAAFAERVRRKGGGETIKGTQVRGIHLQFSAPEMLCGELKPASDQYSLALVFCFAVMGKKRFRGPDTLIEGLSPNQQRALEKALSSASGQRFHSCSEFANAMTDGIPVECVPRPSCD